MKKKIAILSQKKMGSAPRIIREITALEDDFEIILVGDPAINGQSKHAFFDLYRFRNWKDKITGKIKTWLREKKLIAFAAPTYSEIAHFFREQKIQLLIIHEPHLLPLAVKLKKKLGIKIVYNAHEYHPLEFEDVPGWLEKYGSSYTRLYELYLGELDLMINVCESIAEKCRTEFHKDSLVIPNAAYHSSIEPELNANPPFRIIHHGANIASRRIEKMIEIAHLLGKDYELDLMLTKLHGNESYENYIKKLVSAEPNVRLIDPVEFHEIIPSINKYDIGIFYLEPSNFNNRYALPNKLFEFTQAKLAIAVSPSPEMKAMVDKYDLGAVAAEFSVQAMTGAILEMDRNDIIRHKQNAVKAAEVENAEKYQSLFRAQILSLLN